jgi:hypothetical protein
MNRKRLSHLMIEEGFDVVFCNYLRTFRPFYPLPGFFSLCARIVTKSLSLAKLDKIANGWSSPYLYLVAIKSR